MNYISNAIKYGGKPPTITFGAKQFFDGFMRCWTTDNGRGFSPEEHFGGQL
jgi:signal transduction histidine kinase